MKGPKPVCTSARKKMNQSSPRWLCRDGGGLATTGSGSGTILPSAERLRRSPSSRAIEWNGRATSSRLLSRVLRDAAAGLRRSALHLRSRRHGKRHDQKGNQRSRAHITSRKLAISVRQHNRHLNLSSRAQHLERDFLAMAAQTQVDAG